MCLQKVRCLHRPLSEVPPRTPLGPSAPDPFAASAGALAGGGRCFCDVPSKSTAPAQAPIRGSTPRPAGAIRPRPLCRKRRRACLRWSWGTPLRCAFKKYGACTNPYPGFHPIPRWGRPPQTPSPQAQARLLEVELGDAFAMRLQKARCPHRPLSGVPPRAPLGPSAPDPFATQVARLPKPCGPGGKTKEGRGCIPLFKHCE